MTKKGFPEIITRNSKGVDKATIQETEEQMEERHQRTGDFPVESGGSIKISDIRNFYLANDKITLETISERFEVPLKELRVVAYSEDWAKSREEIYRRTRGQIQKVMTDQLKDLLDVNLKIQQLKTIQLMQTVENIQNHLAIYGDLWLRDPDVPGQILKDSNGLPRKIPIPREMGDIENLVKLTQGLNSLIGERDAGNETPLLNGKGDNKEPNMRDVFGTEEDS